MKYFFILLVVVLTLSCKQDRLNVDVSDTDVNVIVNRFDKVVFETDSSEMMNALGDIYNLYPNFIDLYTQDIIRVGNINDDNFHQNFKRFYTDTVYSQVADEVLNRFSNFEFINDQIVSGFKHLKYYFPEKEVPHLFTYISGFNQSIVLAQDLIGINLDKYMGADCIFYQYLGMPQYKIKKMYPEKIVSDLFYAWAITEFPRNDPVDNLLSNSIYQGKLIYFSEAMNPETPDSILIGYSQQQLDWCSENEGLMWAYLAENKLLYSVDRLDLQKYISDGPFTNTFSTQSPGRTGVWLGWQIVRSYMDNNPTVTLQELMNNNNAQQLLSKSKYFPN